MEQGKPSADDLSQHPKLEKILKKIENKPHPIENSNIFQILFLSYLNPLIYLATKATPTDRSHYKLPKPESLEESQKHINTHFKKGNGLIKSFYMAYKGKIVFNLLSSFVVSFAQFFVITLTKDLLDEAQDQIDKFGHLVEKTVILKKLLTIAGIMIFENFYFTWVWIENVRLANRLTGGIYGLLYDKILKVSTVNPHEHDEGSIINYIQNDVAKFNDISYVLLSFLNSIGGIGIGFFLGIYYFNTVFFVLFGGLVGASILIGILFTIFLKVEKKYSEAGDKRLNTWKNILKNMTFIKINALENIFLKRISDRRKEEVKNALKVNILEGMFIMLITLGTAVGTCVFLYAYFKKGGTLSIGTTTVFLRIFDLLGENLITLPALISVMGNMNVSAKRFQAFFDSKEVDYQKVRKTPSELSPYSIEIKEGNFYWDKKISKEEKEELNNKKKKSKKKKDKKLKQENKEKARIKLDTSTSKQESNDPLAQTLLSEQTSDERLDLNSKITDSSENLEIIEEENKDGPAFELNNLNFKANRGNLTIIIGGIGSGKSSLLYSILGEMRVKNVDSQDCLTEVFIDGRIGFVSQNPWLLNGTIRDNILLNKEYDEVLFKEAIKGSALETDLKLWKKKEMKVIGEEGTAISGGQKARVALARCLYQNPDIYIFDDLLSALDSKVGSYIMENTILNHLKEKTVVMVTHALQYLHHSDYVYVLDKAKIEVEGKFEEIQESGLYKKFKELKEKDNQKSIGSETKDSLSSGEEKEERLKEEEKGPEEIFFDEEALEKEFAEDRKAGAVTWLLYKDFINMIGGWKTIVFLVFLSTTIAGLSMYSAQFFESWSSKFEKDSEYKMLIKYLYIGLGVSLSYIVYSTSKAIVDYFLALSIHSQMSFSILHCEMQEFFERIPFGRFLNRLSKDVKSIDKALFDCFAGLISGICSTIVFFATMVYAVGWEILVLILIWIIVCFKLQSIFINVQREYKRVSSIAKSPLVNSCSDTIKGLAVTRNLGITDFMKVKFDNSVRNVLKNNLVRNMLSNWFDLRVILYQQLIIIIPSFLLIIYYFKKIDPGKFGLFFIVIFHIGDTLRQLIHRRVKLEVQMISYERCVYFMKLKAEKNYKTLKEEKRMFGKGGKSRMKKLMVYEKEVKRNQVITEGEIEFQGVYARYITAQSYVLKNLSFKINGGEKIGIVGRTGSGKSSLIKLLWMYIAPSKGKILIDGKDITQLDLKALRSQIEVISQSTSLFEGTLRENLDPTGFSFTDEKLTETLQKLNFTHQNYELKQLDMDIESNGGNLSQGEKQLLCFARSILNKRKLIILDEATASIDVRTENTIQECINTDFTGSTMLIIAHRVQTVMSCHRILVLKAGRIEDFDTPQNLMKKGGFFKEIVDQMNAGKN